MLRSRPWLALAAIGVLLLAAIAVLRTVPSLFKVSPTPGPTTTAVVVLPPTLPPAPTDLPESPTRTETVVVPMPTGTPSPTSIDLPPPCTSAGDTWTRPIDGMEMVCVPAGEFLMGSADDDPDAYDGEKPQHTVYLDAFWIDKTEVTNAQYRNCVEAGACEEPGLWDDDRWNAPDQPVVGVSWHDAQSYAAWAGGQLPTEAEWEKTARGTDGRIYPWGNRPPDCDKASFWGCADQPSAVGSHPDGASPYGALDMAGNVWEWTQSLWGEDPNDPDFKYPYDPEDGREDLQAGDEILRVLRGGAFLNNLRFVRCAFRDRLDPNGRDSYNGFRVVVAPGPSGL